MSLRKRPDGSYVIRFYADGTKGSPQRQETLRGISYDDAVRIYRQRLGKAAARRGSPDDSRVTFKMLAEEYVAVHCAGKSESARARAEQALRVVLPHFGSRIVRDIKPLDVDRYRQKRLAGEIEIEGRKLGPVKVATVKREWAIVKAILNWGEKKGMIERNPIRRGAVAMPKDGPGRLVFFEAEEWERFIGALDDEQGWLRHRARIRTLGPVKEGLQGVRRYGGGLRPDSEATAAYRERLRAAVPYFKTLLYAGSRPSEILRLRWQDVDLERGVISVWQEKTGKPKTVPISKALREVLLALPRGVAAAPVFLRQDGSALTYPDVVRAFSVAKRLAGVRDELSLYSIRHTFASWLAIRGTPIRTIQELLGHEDLRMTIRYAHLSPAHLREAVEGIEAAEKSIGLRVGCASEKIGEDETPPKSLAVSGSPYGNRTRISALRGLRPDR